MSPATCQTGSIGLLFLEDGEIMVLRVPTSFSRSQSKEAAEPDSERRFSGPKLCYFVGTECNNSREKVVP